MQEQDLFRRHAKYLLYFLAIFVLGWGFTTYKTIFIGLILGTTVSFYNHWLLYRKVDKLATKVIEGERSYSLGTITRMASAVLAVFIAMRFPNYVNLHSVVGGLMTSYLVIFIDFYLNKRKTNNNGEER